MSDHIMHVSEEDLILHYYGEGEGEDGERIDRHLSACATCRTEFGRLKHVLALVDANGLSPNEAPGPAFEREVWARLEPHLSQRPSWFARLTAIPKWAFAGGLAATVLIAFLAGRFSREVAPLPTAPAPTVAATDVAERILVLAVVDHLDQSQMVLLEVLNGDMSEATNLVNQQSRARDLVATNRLYRQTAVRAGDDRTGDLLDDLERVLLEIANAPQGATKEDFEALRAQIAERGVLFKVRVVHSEMLERERKALLPGSKS